MKKGETFDIDWKPLALLFFQHLSEKDRRLFCGLEAIRSGVHGVSQVSSDYHIHSHTVRAGKNELLSGNLLPSAKIRRPGDVIPEKHKSGSWEKDHTLLNWLKNLDK